LGNNKSGVTGSYIFFITIITFVLAVFFVLVSEVLASNLRNLTLSFVVLFLIILIGIIFDIIGVAATAATETPFNAMAAKKVGGAKEGIYLVRNADKVASFANDVIGDIAGTVSGAIGISLVLRMAAGQQILDKVFLTVLMTAMIADLTVGGKAAGKRVAVRHANKIIFGVGRFMYRVGQLVGINFGKESTARRQARKKK